MPAIEERYTKTFPISWEQLHRDSKALAWRLVDLGKWEGIIAITRGGMVPASRHAGPGRNYRYKIGGHRRRRLAAG
jgi:hypothetical protein